MSHYPEAFWSLCNHRDDDLADELSELHENASRRQNGSSFCFTQASGCSGNFTNGLIAALASLGGLHAPVTQSREMIYGDHLEFIPAWISEGFRIPGFGNSFHKGEPDPLCRNIDLYLRDKYGVNYSHLASICSRIRSCGKNVFPNVAGYSAVAANVFGLPKGLESLIVIYGRLPAWAAMFAELNKTLPKLA